MKYFFTKYVGWGRFLQGWAVWKQKNMLCGAERGGLKTTKNVMWGGAGWDLGGFKRVCPATSPPAPLLSLLIYTSLFTLFSIISFYSKILPKSLIFSQISKSSGYIFILDSNPCFLVPFFTPLISPYTPTILSVTNFISIWILKVFSLWSIRFKLLK